MKNIIKKLLRETFEIDEMDYQSYKKMDELQSALSRGLIVSVVTVKDDGTVRHMAAKKFLSAYQASTAEKSEKQKFIKPNNDIEKFIDINIYNDLVRKTGDKADAAKKAWRIIRLGNVLAFMVKGRLYDMREENNIKERYGEEIYNSLTKSMVNVMNRDINQPIEGI